MPNSLGMAVQGRDFRPTHYRSASSAYTCVANRVMRCQDRLSKDMRIPEGRGVLFTKSLFQSFMLMHIENMQQYTLPKSATTFYHGRPLWFNSDGNFDVMLISIRRILIIHMALSSPYLETCLDTNIACFVKIGSELSLYILRKYSGGHHVKFPPMGFLGTFSMSFYIIF